MNRDFPRILTLLRRERGISQKSVAVELGISQALLSHYEKGVREPGLDFICRCADFYGVSCDYLLGRSPERHGSLLTEADLPDSDPRARDTTVGGLAPTLNKKLLINSLQILFDLLGRMGHKALLQDISQFLMLSVYRAFRVVYRAHPKNPSTFFSVPEYLYDGMADAAERTAITRAQSVCTGNALPDAAPVAEDKAIPMTAETLAENYPLYVSSLLNLVKNTESKIQPF